MCDAAGDWRDRAFCEKTKRTAKKWQQKDLPKTVKQQTKIKVNFKLLHNYLT